MDIRAWVLGMVVACGPAPGPVDEVSGPQDDTGSAAPDFEADVMPIFGAHCASCHDNDFYGDLTTPDAAYGFLTSTSRFIGPICGWPAEDWVPLLEPGDREQSGLWLVTNGTCDDGTYGMPGARSEGLLVDIDPDATAQIGRWIDAGAPR